jgi:hypothetical protein
LVLRHIAGLTPGEIALRLGKSEAAVHGLHHRGRASLRVALSDLGAAPVTGRTARPVPEVRGAKTRGAQRRDEPIAFTTSASSEMPQAQATPEDEAPIEGGRE